MKPALPKLWFALLAIALWSGCASGGPPLPPSLQLPAPVTDLRAARQGDRVYLSWTLPAKTTDQENVRRLGPTLICRSRAATLKQCGTPVAEVAPPPTVSAKRQAKATARYVDILPRLAGVKPSDEITYAVEVLNDRRRGDGVSNLVRVPLFPAMPPPEGFTGKVTAEGVSFSWACHPTLPAAPGVQYLLRIYRRAEGSDQDFVAAEGNLSGCNGAPLLDTTFEWEKTYDYRAGVITLVSEPGRPAIEIEGNDTPDVRIFTHDIFPPAVPSGLQAVFSGVGQQPFVDLIWSPDADADLAGYNVYRREAGGALVKLNSGLVKTPAYRDAAVQAGKRYFYAVSAVDVRGNESAKSAEASEEVP
jgi:hypothetical protein